MYLKGIYKRNIFQSSDGYVIGLLKVKDNDIDSLLNDKTITFTGYFSNINLEDREGICYEEKKKDRGKKQNETHVVSHFTGNFCHGFFGIQKKI